MFQNISQRIPGTLKERVRKASGKILEGTGTTFFYLIHTLSKVKYINPKYHQRFIEHPREYPGGGVSLYE